MTLRNTRTGTEVHCSCALTSTVFVESSDRGVYSGNDRSRILRSGDSRRLGFYGFFVTKFGLYGTGSKRGESWIDGRNAIRQ
jgi:hypothetical protein